MNLSIEEFYKLQSADISTRLQRLKRKSKHFALYRFFTFLLIFAPIFIFGLKSWLTLFFSMGFIIIFFVLVKRNIQLDKTIRKTAILKKITDDELLALSHSFSHFKNGAEFLNTEHFFSYDLDLFGEGSLFQFINRTSTIGGSEKLATWLVKPPIQNDEITIKQEAVRELSQLTEWRLNFLATGNLFGETPEMHNEIINWSGLDLKLKNAAGIKRLIFVVPFLTVLSFIPALLGLTNLFLWLAVFTQWVLLFFFWKQVTYYFRFFGRKSELLEKYMQLLQIIEEAQFKSELLTKMQNDIRMPVLSSKIFKQLKILVEQFEYRQNFLVGFFLNSFFLWDIRCAYKLWKWHRQYHNKLAAWLETISETDALISLSNFSANNPDFVFPEISEGDFIFQAENLGHPLLHKNKRICNDFEINGWSKVVIITGANMAGKSTFLRTVGVSLILARAGAPVCAGKMVFTPIEIYTNMRTTDSLLKDESYFFAELKRIKGVLELLQKGERIFVILDEMLKGTNSVDKLHGSQELIRKLLRFKSVSLIATHDLKLSELESEFPNQVFNKCFEIRIEEHDLIFDFKLSDGTTKTMNATFLMQKMGII